MVVIPAKAGIHVLCLILDPCLRGDDNTQLKVTNEYKFLLQT